MVELTFYLIGALALTAAIQGCRMLAHAYLGEGRILSRRLARIAEPRRAAHDQPEAGWLADMLDARAPWLRARLIMAGAAFGPDHLLYAALTATAASLCALRLVGLGLALAAPAAILVGTGLPAAVLEIMGAGRRRRFLAQMPQAVDLMARSLQAGHPVATAIALAARQMPSPMGPELTTLIAEMNFGLDRDEAFRSLLRRFPLPELRLVAASLEVTRETGGNIAEVLLKLADTMRSKAQLRQKVQAISAEGRMTLWVISGLPAVVALGITLFRPNYYTEVAGDPLFWPLMAFPPVLILLGAVLIWRMVNFKI